MTTTENTTDATYVLGHPTGEEQRLQRLGQLQYVFTTHLFAHAGIAPGMKILDAATYIAHLREEIRQRHALFPLFFLAGAWAQKG